MSFFGLTALGPQNSFEYSSKNHTFFQIFEISDYENAWKEVAKASKTVTYDELLLIIRALFKGPIPANDNLLIRQAFFNIDLSDSSNKLLRYDDYISVLSSVKQNIEFSRAHKDENTKMTNEVYREQIRKHVRSEDFTETQRLPLTMNQEHGWEKHECHAPTAGKPASDITKFAAELVKNGIYY